MSKIFKHDGGANGRRKSLTLLVSLVLIFTIGVGGTLAWLAASTEPVKNTFTPTQVKNEIHEKFDGETKSDVTVKNTGTTSAFIRAKIIVTWADGDGNVYAKTPAAGEYTLSLGSDWIKYDHGDGNIYYYYKEAVAPGASTTNLINSATYESGAPDGYQLSIEIVSQAIQSEGTDELGNKPVELAWGVDIVENDVIEATIVTK